MIKKLLVASAMLFLQFGILNPKSGMAQGMHFSQYYNAPMLLNPANTALMPEADYRAGVNFRDQWSTVPVPFRTMSAYADFRAVQSIASDNRLGAGIAFFSDKAGDGNLALSRYEGFVAYHLALGEKTMLSAGVSAAYVQRSIDFSKLSFDLQWDGQTYDRSLPNGELPGIRSTSYADIGAGLNLALYPNEAVYMKFGVAVAHINQPTESFYGAKNQLGLRPTGNAEMIARVGTNTIINPSIYYTSQRGAQEFVWGTLFQIRLTGERDLNYSLLLGAYNRWGDAVIPAVGVDIGGLRMMATYDITISALSPYNNKAGAFEVGLRWQGNYPDNSGPKRAMYGCPRF